MTGQAAVIPALVALTCACLSALFYLTWRKRASGLAHRLSELKADKPPSMGTTKTSPAKAVLLPAVAGFMTTGAVTYFSGLPLWAVGLFCVISIFVTPWFVRKRQHDKQLKAFAEEFPNALDVIIRGVKAGLPLVEGIKTIAKDGREPVRSHFAHIVEDQSVGLPLNEAVDRFAARLNTAEARFFAIVVGIQSKSGGSFSEALTNLTNVIRERHKMRRKIRALSAEAKASAMIIGALPIVVALLIHVTSPHYIALLFEDGRGITVLIACGIWMAMGIVVMRKMINFDF
jgi:tight adherence protein B